MRSKRVLPILCAFLTVMLCCAATFAQTGTATISGLITDEGGGTVPDCEVLLKNVDRGTVTTARTNDAGIYVFTSIQPGIYGLTVRRNGFKQVDLPNVLVNVQDHIQQNVRLQVGSVSESVTVTADTLNVNTTDASVSTVVDRLFAENLPLNGRSFNTLLQLTPGVVIAPSSAGAPGQFSISGQRTDTNNFTIDGVSANFGIGLGQNLGQSGTGGAQAFSALGGTNSLVSVDALQEFRIETSTFAPELGRMPGGQVTITTRSGTNDFHGGIFEYFRNTVMDASNWFNGAAVPRIPKAPEQHNDFGAFFGGPISKDKTFFFLSYEGARLLQPQTQVIQVPSAYARSVAPASVAPYLNVNPKPQDQTTAPGVYVSPFTGSFSNRAALNAGSARIDHNFNDRFVIFGRYNRAPSQTLQRVNNLSNLQTTVVDTQTVTAGLTMLLNPRVSNSLRGNYSSQHSNVSYGFDSFGGAVPLGRDALLGTDSAAQNFAYFQNFDTAAYMLGTLGKNTAKQLNFTDDLTLSVGTHQLKFGGDYRDIFSDVNPPQHEPYYFVFSTQGFLSSGSTDLFYTQTNLVSKFLTQALSLYAQDTWKITPRLTATYGLRWELSPAPAARGTTSLAAWKNTGNPADLTIAPPGSPLWATTYGNFAPRFGLAYRLTSRGDLVVRAGGGIFYDLGAGGVANLAFGFPNSFVALAPNVALPVADITPYLPPISVQPPYNTAITAFSEDLKLPRSYQWDAALEKSFAGKQVVSITYSGQAGRDLLRQEVLPAPNTDFEEPLYLTANDARSNYNALQIQYRRPLSAGLQALLNYTWAHSLDNASDDIALALSHAIVSGANDYASSDFDVRHSFSGAVDYSIPGAGQSGFLALTTKGWTIDTVVVARTGFPYNALVETPSPLGGVGYTRPDLVPGQPLYLSGAPCAQVFGPIAQGGNGALLAGQSCPGGKGLNPSAFLIPSTPRQGTEGRNDIPGFDMVQVDLSISRKFRFSEHVSLQFRADAFNVLNHPNFANPFPLLEAAPSSLLSTLTMNERLGGLNPLFQEGGPRSLQLSLRLVF